jgi:hypothetical protein
VVKIFTSAAMIEGTALDRSGQHASRATITCGGLVFGGLGGTLGPLALAGLG